MAPVAPANADWHAPVMPAFPGPSASPRGISQGKVMNQTTKRTLRKLAQAALFSAVRAAAAAVGTGIVAAIIWWLHH